MRRLLFGTVMSLMLIACIATPTPNLEATVQEIMVATQDALTVEAPSPTPTSPSSLEHTSTATLVPPTAKPTTTTEPTDTATPVPPTAKPTATPEPTDTATPTPPIATPTADGCVDTGRRYIGVVKWFSDVKGYGFIESDCGDVFVHYSQIEVAGFRTLKEGQRVEFNIEQGPKGLQAARVIPLD